MTSKPIKGFNTKEEIFKYLKKLFAQKSKIILIRGSSANREIKKFSDLDIEVYSEKLRKPYYEIAFLKNKPLLISVYFYKYKQGKKIKEPKNVKVLYGEYNNSIKPTFSKDKYNNKQKIQRECQLAVDFMFKYLRTKNKSNLEFVNRRIK